MYNHRYYLEYLLLRQGFALIRYLWKSAVNGNLTFTLKDGEVCLCLEDKKLTFSMALNNTPKPNEVATQ